MTRFSLARGTLCGVATALFLTGAGLSLASAASGPFDDFNGNWSGTGTITLANGDKERIRCTASYRVRGSSGSEVDVSLKCASDSYKFDLTGDFRAADGQQISGQWTERTRGVGGSIIGQARGNRMQVRAETGGFGANLSITTQNRRQSVTIDSRGAGETVQTSITLQRN